MPQVNTLAIDIAPSNDFSPAQSSTLGSSNSSLDSSGKDFAKIIDQHYQDQQSGKNSEVSGNKTKVADNQQQKNNDKSSTSEVQSKDKESGTISDADLDVEVPEPSEPERVIFVGNSKDKKSVHLENNKKESTEQQVSEFANEESLAINAETTKSSTEQLMSFLSASKKILSGDIKNENKISTQVGEGSLKQTGKNQDKAEIDLLLKQILAGNDKEKVEQPTEKSVKENIVEQVKAKPEVAIEGLVKKINEEDKLSINNKNVEKVLSKVTGIEQKTLVETTKKQPGLAPKTAKEIAVNAELMVDNSNNLAKQQMSASEIEALLTDIENSPASNELEKAKTEFLANQEKVSTTEQGAKATIKIESSPDKPLINSTVEPLTSSESLENGNSTNIDSDSLNTDKVAFAGVTVSGEKQAQESNQNNSRVINQATQKVVEQQASNTGSQPQEQPSDQANKNLAATLTDAEKVAASDIQLKDKPVNELFDKKILSASVESTLSRDAYQVNETTKSAVSAEEMITKLTSESAQSTAQSVTNAKQVTSLQNEALSVYQKDFAGAVKDKVMVMMNQKLQQIEIRLDPQELGSVNVKINLQNEQAVVSFTVQNQQAKEAFEQNLGRLKEMLAESGVDVGDANVEQQNKQGGDEQLGNGRQQGNGDAIGEDLLGLSDTQTLNLVKGSSTGVDYYA
jgi:flagellar hook-length control protein FliK